MECMSPELLPLLPLALTAFPVLRSSRTLKAGRTRLVPLDTIQRTCSPPLLERLLHRLPRLESTPRQVLQDRRSLTSSDSLFSPSILVQPFRHALSPLLWLLHRAMGLNVSGPKPMYLDTCVGRSMCALERWRDHRLQPSTQALAWCDTSIMQCCVCTFSKQSHA